jgi:repressor LexA
MQPVTHRQQAVLDLISDRWRTKGYSPTVREIGAHLGIRSPNGVVCHLRALERKGLILHDPLKSRGIRLKTLPTLPRLRWAGKIS